MAVQSHGHHGSKPLWHCQQWKQNTWPCLTLHAKCWHISHFSKPFQSSCQSLSSTQTMKLPNPSQNASQNINDPSTSIFDITSFEITSKKGLSTSNTSPALNKLPIFSQNPFQESNIKQLCKLYALTRSFSVFNQILRRIQGGRVLLILLILFINQYYQNTRFFSSSSFILHQSGVSINHKFFHNHQTDVSYIQSQKPEATLPIVLNQCQTDTSYHPSSLSRFFSCSISSHSSSSSGGFSAGVSPAGLLSHNSFHQEF